MLVEGGESREGELLPFFDRSTQEERPPQGERAGVPIDIEARLAKLDVERGRAVDIETPLYRAPDIMDDRLTELHSEIAEKGDQASRDLMNTLDFTYKMFYLFELQPEKRLRYFRAYQIMRDEHLEAERYYFSAQAESALNGVLERAGLGKAWWCIGQSEGNDYTLPYPDADFIKANYLPDEEEISKRARSDNAITISEVTED
jgi:hypothetical protein